MMSRNFAPWPLAAALLLTALSVASASALGIGDPIPKGTITMKNVDGRNLTIASAAGPKGTLVLFSCNHCPWVRAWEDRMVRVAADARKRGIGVIAINSNDPAAYAEDSYAKMVTRAKEHGYGFPYVVDATSEVAIAFGATHTPEAFLFDSHGKLVYHGAVDDNARQPDQVKATWLADAVVATSAGKPVPLAETKALGCSIKFRGSRSD
jgi:peroxiredoxin